MYSIFLGSLGALVWKHSGHSFRCRALHLVLRSSSCLMDKHKTSLVMILKYLNTVHTYLFIYIYVIDILKLYIFESMGSHHIRSASDKDSMTTSMNLQFQTKKIEYVIRRCNHLAFLG